MTYHIRYTYIKNINLVKMESKHAKNGMISYYVHAFGQSKREMAPYGTYLKWIIKKRNWHASFCTNFIHEEHLNIASMDCLYKRLKHPFHLFSLGRWNRASFECTMSPWQRKKDTRETTPYFINEKKNLLFLCSFCSLSAPSLSKENKENPK